MQINGGSDVPADLTFADDQTGDTMAITLSEESTNAGAWTIDVYVQTGETRSFVGRILTTVAAVRAAGGLDNNRIIACVSIPGARRWYLQIRCTPQQIADIFVSSSKLGSGAFGISPVSP